jgi:hypothetical protein
MSERLHVLTACSRPENLARVAESIAAAACEPWEVCWHVRLDRAREHVGGQALKNRMLDQITDGWVCFLDDDTVMHPDFLTAVAENQDAHMVVVSQRRTDGRTLVAAAANMRVGHVDIGQAAIRRERIDSSIPEHYEGDGVFLADVAATARVAYVAEVLSFHNALDPVAA